VRHPRAAERAVRWPQHPSVARRAEAALEDGLWPDRILVTDSQRVKDPIKWKQSAVMTSRWRLVNGTELYDIQADPGQQQNVAAEHPEVIARLRAFYEDWWAELEPTFQQATPIHLGHPAENPTTLTCHDWITAQLTPWHQGFVRRAMGGEGNTGFWNVQVVADGTYEIRLRRWPVEVDRAIRSDLAPGDAVPGERAFRTEPGKAFQAVRAKIQIGEVEYQDAVPADAKEVVFRLPLTAGMTTLSGRFYDAAGDWIGAYYAYVEKF
jgi:hypothetical protein